MSYDYRKMCRDITAAEGFGIAEVFSIGKSVMGREIPCAKVGTGKTKVFLSGAYHGLEYLTSTLLNRFLRDYTDCVITGERLFDCDIRRLYSSVMLYIAPMINPDGVDIAINGIELSNPIHRRLIENVGILNFSRVWQANARGVDINHNFDALWQSIESKPSPTKYGGFFPESEPETRAVTGFLRKEKPRLLIAFHSQGGEIYYDFNGKEPSEARGIADNMAEASGYKVCAPTGTASFGGCKDWFISELGGLGFTVEIGHGCNPLPLSMLDSVYKDNAKLILAAMLSAAA